MSLADTEQIMTIFGYISRHFKTARFPTKQQQMPEHKANYESDPWPIVLGHFSFACQVADTRHVDDT